MSFSWWCVDRSGNDLFKEYGVHYQALGLGPNNPDATEAPHRVSNIRAAFTDFSYADKFEDAARDAIALVQQMARANRESLKSEPHCPSCRCAGVGTYRTPHYWSVESIDRLLAIPLERVWRCGGGS